jgi:hypothetical protein
MPRLRGEGRAQNSLMASHGGAWVHDPNSLAMAYADQLALEAGGGGSTLHWLCGLADDADISPAPNGITCAQPARGSHALHHKASHSTHVLDHLRRGKVDHGAARPAAGRRRRV